LSLRARFADINVSQGIIVAALPVAVFKGPTCKGMEGERGERAGREKGREDEGKRRGTIRYDTIRDAILTCARKPT